MVCLRPVGHQPVAARTLPGDGLIFSYVSLRSVTWAVIRAPEPRATPWATASEILVTPRSTAPKKFSPQQFPSPFAQAERRSPICILTEAPSVTSVPRNMRGPTNVRTRWKQT